MPGQVYHPDHRTLAEFLQALPGGPGSLIPLLRDHHFGQPFPGRIIEEGTRFLDFHTRPDKRFLDPELEQLKEALVHHLGQFLSRTETDTFTHERRPDLLCVPTEWSWEQPERWHAAVEELNATATRIVQLYDELVRTARERTAQLPAEVVVESTGSTQPIEGARADVRSRAKGPEPPNLFWWDGRRYEFPPIQWRLLSVLWDKDHVPVEEACGVVWGQAAVPETTLHPAISKLRRMLYTFSIPLEIRVRNGYFCMEWFVHETC